MIFSCLVPAKRRSSGSPSAGARNSVGIAGTTSAGRRASQGQSRFAATAEGRSRSNARRTVAMGATMATRISQGSMTTSAFLRSKETRAATRGVRLGGARYMTIVVTS